MKDYLTRVVQIICIMVMCFSTMFSQSVYNTFDNDRENEPLLFPWAGGMNAIQYCDID